MITLQQQSLDWALAHVEACGDTDVFPMPFEYKAIRHDWDRVKTRLSEQNVLDWTVRPLRIMLAPKARHGFRVITQLDPLDFLMFAAIIREICLSVEDRRISKSDEIVHSYRVKPTLEGQLYDRETGYHTFLDASRKILAEDSQISYVAVTDISDFYSRIYHHRLENALRVSTDQVSHVNAIMHLLSGWNSTETFGIPVGNAPCRLLAEITLNDVDEALLMSGTQFLRFNDDYRIFAQTHAEAYRKLAFLADTLFRNHGLTLQRQKTWILSCEEYQSKFLTTPLDHEINSLHSGFEQLVAGLGMEDPYEEINYADLDEEQKELVDSWNLASLLNEQIDSDGELDLRLTRFILHRLAQLKDSSAVDILLDNLDTLYPVFPDIVKHVEQFAFLGDEFRLHVGERLLKIYEDSIVSELTYHRLWCLNIFTKSKKWGQHERFFQLYSKAQDYSSRRKLILAMGQAEQRHWFQKQWRNLTDFPAWPRRAFLAGASCMSPDARKHWYRSVEPQLDLLERTVAKWARQNPFSES